MCFLKGLPNQILWGLFWPAWLDMADKSNLYHFLYVFFCFFNFWQPF